MEIKVEVVAAHVEELASVTDQVVEQAIEIHHDNLNRLVNVSKEKQRGKVNPCPSNKGGFRHEQ